MNPLVFKTALLTLTISSALAGIAASLIQGEHLVALSFFVSFAGGLAGAVAGTIGSDDSNKP